jgi:ankyrin repeat protein
MIAARKMLNLSAMVIGVLAHNVWGAQGGSFIVRSFPQHSVLYDASQQKYFVCQPIIPIASACTLKRHIPSGNVTIDRKKLLYPNELSYVQFEDDAAKFCERDEAGKVKMFHILSGEKQEENVKNFQAYIAETGPIVGYELLFNRDHMGWTPWHAVVNKNHTIVMKTVINFVQQNRELNTFICDDALWRLLITRRCTSGFSPLHDIVVSNQEEAAKLFLDVAQKHELDLVGISDFDGQSVIEWAILGNKSVMLALLLPYATPELRSYLENKYPEAFNE